MSGTESAKNSVIQAVTAVLCLRRKKTYSSPSDASAESTLVAMM